MKEDKKEKDTYEKRDYEWGPFFFDGNSKESDYNLYYKI